MRDPDESQAAFCSYTVTLETRNLGITEAVRGATPASGEALDEPQGGADPTTPRRWMNRREEPIPHGPTRSRRHRPTRRESTKGSQQRMVVMWSTPPASPAPCGRTYPGLAAPGPA